MYSWSVVVSKRDSAEYESLQLEGRTCEFHTKRNAQLFAESYVFEHILKVDGVSRLEPFVSLPSVTSSMKGLEVTRDYISKIVGDESITNLSRHYIVGNRSSPWSLTVHKIHIFMRPVTTTTIIEETKEEEVEEEREVSKKINIIVPGRFYNGREERTIIETVKEKVKKQVPVQRTEEVTTQERVVKSQDIFTVMLLKSKSADHLNPIEREKVMIVAKQLSDEFTETKTAKMILAVAGSDVPYRVSELLDANPEEFSLYRPPERSSEKKRSAFSRTNDIELKNIQKKDVDTEPLPVNLRRAPSMKVNTGASLAGLGAEFLKRREEMFPSSTK